MKILITESQYKLIKESSYNNPIIKMGLNGGDIMVKYRVWRYEGEKEEIVLDTYENFCVDDDISNPKEDVEEYFKSRNLNLGNSRVLKELIRNDYENDYNSFHRDENGRYYPEAFLSWYKDFCGGDRDCQNKVIRTASRVLHIIYDSQYPIVVYRGVKPNEKYDKHGHVGGYWSTKLKVAQIFGSIVYKGLIHKKEDILLNHTMENRMRWPEEFELSVQPNSVEIVEKYVNNVKEVMELNESLSDIESVPLYHFTSDRNAISIIKNNEIDGSIPYAEMVVKDKQLNTKRGPYQVSFTRNKNWSPNPSSLGPGNSAPENLDVIFVVDKERLKTKYRVIPFDYSGLASNPWNRNTKEYKDFFNDDEEPEDMFDYERSDEYEERVITDRIQPLRPYLIDIIYRGDNPEVQSIINQYMGLNENNEPPIGNIRDRVWNKFQEESNFNAEVVRYYVDRFRHLTGEPLDEKILNHTWDHIKSTVDSHNDTITNKGDVKSNFINSFNHVWENYDKFECAYIWDDEEMDIQDSLGVIANLVMKDPSLLSSVPENELSKNLKYLVKILHDKTSIILYRVLFVKSLENINYNNLGTHWTYTHKAYHKDVIQYLYDSAENTNDDYEITPNDLYIIKVLSPTSNISYPATLWASICFGSSEHEVTLFQTNNLKILKSKHFKIPPSWDIH